MLKKIEKLFPYLETDNEEQKELVNLYNDWHKDTAFLSQVPRTNPKWDILEEYCMKHKELVKEFWIEMYNQFGEVGHFTFMLFKLFPNIVEVVDEYCPLKDIEKCWLISFIAQK